MGINFEYSLVKILNPKTQRHKATQSLRASLCLCVLVVHNDILRNDILQQLYATNWVLILNIPVS